MKDLAGFKERYPLNSRLVKQNGKLVEEVYRVGGRYDAQIRRDRRAPRGGRAVCDRADGQGAEGAREVLSDRRDRRPRRLRHRLGRGQGLAGRHDQRLHRGLHGRPRDEGLVGRRSSSTSTREKTAEIRKLAADAQWFEDRMPWDPKYRKQGVTGITANAIDVVIETGDSAPITPVGINLPNDQEIREKHGSKSVSLSNVNEAYDKSTLGRVPARVRVDAGGGGAGREVEQRRRRADDQHARGDRARVGQDLRAAEGQPAGGAQGAVFGARGSARRSRGALLPARSEARRARPGRGEGPQRDRPGRVRGLHAQRARPAPSHPRRARRSKKTTCATGR